MIFLVYILVFKKKKIGDQSNPSEILKPHEIDELVEEWEPKPLLSATPEEIRQEKKQIVIEGRVGLKVNVKVRRNDQLQLCNTNTYSHPSLILTHTHT